MIWTIIQLVISGIAMGFVYALIGIEYTLIYNASGVLSQVSRLFSRKGYNIESLAVGATDNPEISRITIEVLADDLQITQIMNQLGKMFVVHSVKRLDSEHSIRRELVLIKVQAAAGRSRRIVRRWRG